MDISIVLCTYNRCGALRRALNSIQTLKSSPEITWEALVVDNNSKDRTKETVEACIRRGRADLKYLFEGRQGKSFALNTGIQAARGSIVAFTDDDVIVHPDWLLRMKETFHGYQCAGMGGKIVAVFPAGGKPDWLRTDTPFPFMNALVHFDRGERHFPLQLSPFGANMAFKKEVFLKHGLFRTDLGPTMGNTMGKGEDVEYSRRLLAAGELIMYDPRAVVYHTVEKERLEKSYFRSWYFNYGKYLTRTEETSESSRCIAGVPFYALRILFGNILGVLCSRNVHNRILCQLKACQVMGAIKESFVLTKSIRSAAITVPREQESHP
jgi:glycosyltransferase involved in cell wall biosynthesis